MKKLFLISSLLLCSLSIFSYSGTCGDPNVNGGKNVKWTLSNGTLTISGSGAMLDYKGGATSTSEMFGWTNYRSEINKVVIKSGVTNVGTSAFVDCSKLSSVTLASSVTEIGSDAFNACGSLKNIVLPNALTTIGSRSFQATNIKKITFPSTIQDIGMMAFLNAGLDTVICEAITPPSLGLYAFGYSTMDILYVHNVETYKNDASWRNKFKEIQKIDGSSYYTVSLTCDKSKGYVFGDGSYKKGTTIEISATPKDGYEFVRWSDGNTANPRTLTVTKDISLTAEFTSQYTITLNCDQLQGSVSGGGTYAEGTTIEISAKPKNGYEFVRWSDGNTDNPRILTVTKDISLTAEFTSQYTITLNCNQLQGSVSGGGTYKKGTIIKISATPKYGYKFVRWSDGNTANPRTLTVTKNLTLTAEFAEIDDNEVIDSGTCGENLTWTLTYYGVLIISGTGDMEDYYIDEPSPWNNKKNNIEKLIVEYGVTSIGRRAFYYCSSLTSVDIGNSVTSIGEEAFRGCSSLTSVAIGNSVTSIGDWAFSYCSSLTSVDIPHSVTSIGDDAFRSCSSLTSVDIGNSVTSIGGWAFSGCTSLTTVICEAINVPALGSGAFPDYASEQRKLYVPAESLDDYKAADQWKDFGYIFPIGGTYSITLTCNLEHGTVSGDGVYQAGETATLTATPKDGYKFVRWSDDNTINPRTLTVTEDLTLTAEFAIIEDDDVIDSGTCGENLMWTLTYNGVLIISGTGDMEDYYIDEPSPWNNKKNNIKKLIVMAGVTSIGDDAFSECSSLTSVDIGNSVTSIGDWAFYYCSSLTSIIIPNSVTSIGEGAFFDCTSLTSITIPNSVTSIGDYAFCLCTSLTTIICKAIKVPTLGDYVFDNIPQTEATLYVPAESLEDYKAANQWKYFGNILPIDNITYSITLTCNPEHGTVSGGGVYQVGETATLTATPKDGYEFVRWSDGNTANPRTLTVTADLTLTAEFAKINIPTYTVTLTCNPEHGTVSGGGVYQVGETATLTATPKDGYEFVRWSDGNTANPRTLTVTADLTLTAEFAKINIPTYTVTLTCNPEHGTVSGGGVYQVGETATLTATPKDGYEFVRWSDGSTANPRTLTVTKNLTLTAEFAEIDDNEVIDSGKCGKNLTWTLTYNGVLTISGTGDMYNYDYTNNLAPWNNVSNNIKYIVLPEGLTSIGEWAFYLCASVTSISIPEGVSSIGVRAFCNCSSLTSISIPNSVTSIGERAFYSCYNLASVTLSTNLSKIDKYLFGQCRTLTAITIPNNVTAIENGAFSGCSSLDSVSIEATNPPVLSGSSTFSSSPTCYIPCGTLAAYQSSSWAQQVGSFVEQCDGNDNNQSLISVTDGTLSDWDKLPMEYLFETKCVEGASWDALKSVKVYADLTYINLVVEWDTEIVTDLSYVPFHVYLNMDNDAPTGGFGGQWIKPNIDLLLEGYFYLDGNPCAYQPDVALYAGSPLANEWAWDWTTIEALAASQLITKGVMEIQIEYGKLPVKLKNTFTVGFDIQQSWSSVGVLPNAANDNSGNSVLAEKMLVRINNVNTPNSVEDICSPSSITYTHKLLRNGQLIIIRDGIEYTVIGQELERLGN